MCCSDVNASPPAFLQASIEEWMSTDRINSQCGSTIIGPLQPGSPHFFGNVVVQTQTGQFL